MAEKTITPVEVNLHPFNTEELACYIAGLDYDEIDADTAIIDDKMIELFGIDLDNFHRIICRLLPMIDVGNSPLSGTRYKGFAVDQSWLVKMEIANTESSAKIVALEKEIERLRSIAGQHFQEGVEAAGNIDGIIEKAAIEKNDE
jgi:hypothetical protein